MTLLPGGLKTRVFKGKGYDEREVVVLVLSQRQCDWFSVRELTVSACVNVRTGETAVLTE
jgi:hypothetical protein